MFKIFVTVDKHQTTSIRLEHLSSNAENLIISNC